MMQNESQFEQVDQNQLSNDVQTIKEAAKSFHYKILKEAIFVVSDKCFTIAMNPDLSILVAGCDFKIKIFSYSPQIEEIQVIPCEEKIYAIQFLKNQFITGGDGGQMKLWDLNQQNFCTLNQVLPNSHLNQVNAIIITRDENMIISCSNDQTIKTWIKREDQWEFSQSYNNFKSINQISINKSENFLSNVVDDQIQILKINQDKYLKKFQRIQPPYQGNLVCFIENDYLVYCVEQKVQLAIFKQDHKNQLFSIWQTLPIGNTDTGSTLFPMMFNEEKNLLIFRKGFSIFIIKRTKQEQFHLIQEIMNFTQINGFLTKNGQYFVTWEKNIFKFKIREFTEM